MHKIRMQQRYKCDFCYDFTGIKWRVERHEKSCYMNPNRVCFACNNTGTIKDNYEYNGNEWTYYDTTCPFCEIYNSPETKEKRERKIKEKEEQQIDNIKVPF